MKVPARRHSAVDRCAVEDEIAADHIDVAGDLPGADEGAILTGGDGHIASKGAVEHAVAGGP